MWEWLNNILEKFRKNFNREACFKWFVIIIIGMMLRTDKLGVTSIIRALGLKSKSYESMIHFYHSKAWNRVEIREKWIEIVRETGCLYLEKGYPVIVGDGVKQAKEAKMMPGVKKHHQESGDSSKAEYIMGHHFGAIGVLTGTREKLFCTPIDATIQNGVNPIRKWEDSKYKEESHVVQMVKNTCEVTKTLGRSIVLLDAYFLTEPALTAVNEYEEKNGESLIIVTRAKASGKAYEKAPERTGKRGRPCKKGEDVKLMELFEKSKEEFKEATVEMYGKEQKLRYLCKDLLWGEGLYQEIRFVLIQYGNTKTILACTSRELEPLEIIRLYSYRFKIEVTFKEIKQEIAGLSYHFWSKSMPEIEKYKKKDAPDPLEKVTEKKDKEAIIATLKAIEGYVLFSLIAAGLLQLISQKFKDIINKSTYRYLRTKSSSTPSETTVAAYMKKTIYSAFTKMSKLRILQIIESKQETYDEEMPESA